ncbi:MAG TPA: hypothetical protein GXX25_14565 [Desulfotomaculum sp.]|nr:hypothetical protein [Desulfotomaculum sp.]
MDDAALVRQFGQTVFMVFLYFAFITVLPLAAWVALNLVGPCPGLRPLRAVEVLAGVLATGLALGLAVMALTVVWGHM